PLSPASGTAPRRCRGAVLPAGLSRQADVCVTGRLFEERSQVAALLGGQLGAKAAADRLPVYRPGAPQRVSAGRGQGGETSPSVGFVWLAFGQPPYAHLLPSPAPP